MKKFSQKDWREKTVLLVGLPFLILLCVFSYFEDKFPVRMLVVSFFGFLVLFGLFTGYMLGMGGGLSNPSADQKKDPAGFWLNFTFYLILAISFAFPEIWKPVMDAIVRWRDPIVN